jgi:hypothetical protein
MHPRHRTLRAVTTACAMLALVASTTYAADATLPNGTPISVTIDSPTTGDEFIVPAGSTTIDLPVSGTAAVGEGEPDATFIYVIDVSFSSLGASGGNCGGDRNGDGAANTILDCEIAFVLALNAAAVGAGSVDEVSVVVYGENGAVGDMAPDAGDQLVTAPDAGNLEIVAGSAFTSDCAAGLTQFAMRNVGCDGTDFAAGLNAVATALGDSSNGTNVVLFMSDGLSNQGGGDFAAALASVAGTGAVAQTIAVGAGSACTGGIAGTLQQIADTTGGACTAVADPENLPDLIPDLVASTLDSLTLAIDGGAPAAIPNSEIAPDLPQDGPASVTYATTAAGLAPGARVLCVTANGTDVGGAGSVTECETVHLFQIALAPPEATNELGTPGQTHSVTATIAGEPGTVGSRLVDFSIGTGPNAGQVSDAGECTPNPDCTTDASGAVTWTYPAAQGPTGLGDDAISACFSVAGGATGCAGAVKHWVDTTPPTAACNETTNPSGGNVPRAGQSLPNHAGQNEDGFYELTATDAVDPDPEIFILDGGSGTVFGPFASGTRIKYTEANRAPTQRPMGGTGSAVAWHLWGTGDAWVYAVDDDGNASDPLGCLVPAPPK